MQNYPNPFNPETEITFTLPERVNVMIRIYNSAGEETATLLNEVRSKGYHILIWNAADYPSGIYYYQLVSDGISITRKMVLLK